MSAIGGRNRSVAGQVAGYFSPPTATSPIMAGYQRAVGRCIFGKVLVVRTSFSR